MWHRAFLYNKSCRVLPIVFPREVAFITSGIAKLYSEESKLLYLIRAYMICINELMVGALCSVALQSTRLLLVL